MTSEEIVAGLQRTPLLSIPKMKAEFDTRPLAHGMYAWWLTRPEAMPVVPTTAHPSEPVGLLYIGIGPSSARSRRKLRDRFNDHTRKNTGSSTFRLVLASFLFEQEGWQPFWTDRPMLTKADNAALSNWQADNLLAQWVEIAEPWKDEAAVISAMRPPLNRGHNQTHEFYETVGNSRDAYRVAARKNRSV